jgi:hypothetical protein
MDPSNTRNNTTRRANGLKAMNNAARARTARQIANNTFKGIGQNVVLARTQKYEEAKARLDEVMELILKTKEQGFGPTKEIKRKEAYDNQLDELEIGLAAAKKGYEIALDKIELENFVTRIPKDASTDLLNKLAHTFTLARRLFDSATDGSITKMVASQIGTTIQATGTKLTNALVSITGYFWNPYGVKSPEQLAAEKDKEAAAAAIYIIVTESRPKNISFYIYIYL